MALPSAMMTGVSAWAWGMARSAGQPMSSIGVRVLEGDPRGVHHAAAEAQCMSDYLIGRVRWGISHANDAQIQL